MNPDSNNELREQLEVRIVALLMGEASAFEAAELERLMKDDPELAAFHTQMKRTLALVQDASKKPVPASVAPPKLSADRRKVLLAHFKQSKETVVALPDKPSGPRPVFNVATKPRKSSRWLVPVAIAAGFMLMAGLMLPSLSRSKTRSMRVSELAPMRSGEMEEVPSSQVEMKTANRARRKAMDDSYNARAFYDDLAAKPAVPASPPPVTESPAVPYGTTASLAVETATVFLPESGVTSTDDDLGVATALPRLDFDGKSTVVVSGISRDQTAAPKTYGVRLNTFNPGTINGGKMVAGMATTWGIDTGSGAGEKAAAGVPAEYYAYQVTNAAPGFGLNFVTKTNSLGGTSYGLGDDVNMVAADVEGIETRTIDSLRKAGVDSNALAATVAAGRTESDSLFADARQVPQQDWFKSEDAVENKKRDFFAEPSLKPALHGKAGVSGKLSEAEGLSRAGEAAAPADKFFAWKDNDGNRPSRLRQENELRSKSKNSELGGEEPRGSNVEVIQSLNYSRAAAENDYLEAKREASKPKMVAARNRLDNIDAAVKEVEKRLVQETGKTTELSLKKRELSDAPAKKPATPPPAPQPEVSTRENAFSTFSLNVSDVSFKLAAAGLENGVMPDASSIRVEEFINAFNYRDPAPAPGARLAFAWERARYPFAHNRDVVRFAVQTAAQGRDAQKPLNVVLMLDNSGSMERSDRVAILREALKVLAQQLRPQDRISVIAFSRTAHLWVDGMAGGDPQALLSKVLERNPEGGTNLEEAMNLAYNTATRHYVTNGVNRVILLTDGAANLGNIEPEDLKEKVVSHRQRGIAFDCFGIGWEGYNDDLLEVLSRNGDGRYGFLNRPEQAGPDFANQLAGALNVSASDVKTQVEFNPRRVTSWRQIGYAKHQLTKEQFRDNTVDAAEIAAAEQGNALYVIETNPEGEGPIGVVRVRFKVPATGEYIEQEWPLAYQPRAAALDQSSPALRLATGAAAFGEWLASSPYAAEVNLSALQNLLRDVPEHFSPDPRPQQLSNMIRQAQGIVGK